MVPQTVGHKLPKGNDLLYGGGGGIAEFTQLI
jgi:hypothetical protein